MSKASDKYRAGDHFVYDGVEHGDLEDLIQAGFLGFCTCGLPEASLAHICRGLELVDLSGMPSTDATPRQQASWASLDAQRKWSEQRSRDRKAHFHTDGAEFHFYYWADNEGLTEHGGSVPGWLTDKGREVIELIKELEAA